jgi:uncharacterized protein YutE (UPF0331/DUF86 family)
MAWDAKYAAARVEDLRTILRALNAHKDVTEKQMRQDLTCRWAIEHGMLAAADAIFDLLNYILAERFGLRGKSYEDTLRRAEEKGLLAPPTYERLRGLGNARNRMAHPRLEADVARCKFDFDELRALIPRVAKELADWLGTHKAG